MKDKVHTSHCIFDGVGISHISQIEFQLWIAVLLTHIILFFLITGKDTDLFDIGI